MILFSWVLQVLVRNRATHEKGGRLAAFVELLTNLLLYESFLREYSIRKKIIVRFRQFVPFFLEDYKLVIDRQCGMPQRRYQIQESQKTCPQ